MSRQSVLTHKFVDCIPEDPQEGIVYVSVPFATAVHRCCCGCGSEVVTPLTPTDWELIFNGEAISLYPSVGNWSLPCKSHYWITRNRVRWALPWSQKRIQMGRDRDHMAKEGYFKDRISAHDKGES